MEDVGGTTVTMGGTFLVWDAAATTAFPRRDDLPTPRRGKGLTGRADNETSVALALASASSSLLPRRFRLAGEKDGGLEPETIPEDLGLYLGNAVVAGMAVPLEDAVDLGLMGDTPAGGGADRRSNVGELAGGEGSAEVCLCGDLLLDFVGAVARGAGMAFLNVLVRLMRLDSLPFPGIEAEGLCAELFITSARALPTAVVIERDCRPFEGRGIPKGFLGSGGESVVVVVAAIVCG